MTHIQLKYLENNKTVHRRYTIKFNLDSNIHLVKVPESQDKLVPFDENMSLLEFIT